MNVSVLENLLTNQLMDYKPDILFSYPESKAQQQGILQVRGSAGVMCE